MLKRYKYAFDAVEIGAFRDMLGERQINFRVLLTQLPSIVSVITDNLKEIEGKIFLHETLEGLPATKGQKEQVY